MKVFRNRRREMRNRIKKRGICWFPISMVKLMLLVVLLLQVMSNNAAYVLHGGARKHRDWFDGRFVHDVVLIGDGYWQ